MRLYTFEYNGQQRIGAEDSGGLVDLRVAHAAMLTKKKGSAGDSGDALFADMLSLLRGGEQGMDAARQALEFGAADPDAARNFTRSFDEVKLHPPIPRPGKILCSGINYLSHKEENPAAKMPTAPFFFSKLPSAVIGPQQPIILPERSQQVDYEIELAVCIGRKMSHVSESEVMDSIAGYTILHDVSARDVQFKDNQITLGKNFDTFSPLGPCLVTKDELSEPNNLRLRTVLNNQVMQDGSTREWVFPLPTLISFLSQVMTLEPGDVVSTGTPAGVGVFRNPQIFLKPGDHVILEIEGIGRLENPVVAANQRVI